MLFVYQFPQAGIAFKTEQKADNKTGIIVKSGLNCAAKRVRQFRSEHNNRKAGGKFGIRRSAAAARRFYHYHTAALLVFRQFCRYRAKFPAGRRFRSSVLWTVLGTKTRGQAQKYQNQAQTGKKPKKCIHIKTIVNSPCFANMPLNMIYKNADDKSGMSSGDLTALLLQVIKSWQVIAISAALVLYMFLVSYVARTYHRPKYVSKSKPKKAKIKIEKKPKKEKPAENANDELGLSEG
jgi:hypothetical protein